jgi:hypothetical protein
LSAGEEGISLPHRQPTHEVIGDAMSEDSGRCDGQLLFFISVNSKKKN